MPNYKDLGVSEYKALKQEIDQLKLRVKSDTDLRVKEQFISLSEFTASNIIIVNDKFKFKECDLKLEFNITGDCDFSFNSSKIEYKNLLIKLNKLAIREFNYKERIETVKVKLDYCSRIHYSLVNTSIFPKIFGNNGQSLNQNKNNFRFDRYIRGVAKYYDPNINNTVKLNIEKSPEFINFFSRFENIEDFCKQNYFISAETTHYILNHSNSNLEFYKPNLTIERFEELEKYLEVAYHFWYERLQMIKKLKEE